MPKADKIKDFEHLARLAVEFTYQAWSRDCEDIMPRPPSGIYWTVRLGLLALQTDGTWAYWTRISSMADKAVARSAAKQRFPDFASAVAAAVKVFGMEPDNVAEMRPFAAQLEATDSALYTPAQSP